MAKNGRLLSLDIFRGMTVALMIIVNTPGSWNYVYPPLRHSEWHGCTPTDMVFPFFLFIVGAAMWFSLKKFGHELTGASLFRIIRRTVTIFALGLFLRIFPYFLQDYSLLRIMGVLQRIAIAYGLGALICMMFNRNYLWLVTAIILMVYWGLLVLFGGADPYGLESNLVRKIDLAVLGINHLYNGYGIPFDPEGLLSTLPAICTVIIGYYTGYILDKGKAVFRTVMNVALIGAALIGLGLLWNKLFPINKPLWTSSYVLYTAGYAMVILSAVYWITDVLKFQKWGLFFTVFGINALFSYFMSGIWTRMMLFIKIPAEKENINLYTWIYENIFAPFAGNMPGSLIFAIVQMLLIWLLALLLFRKKILIRL
jgi:predicted acyltransferase